MDGAMGTLLQGSNLVKPGDCLDNLCLTYPEKIRDIHQLYADAGVGIILTNTFGANGAKLANFGLELKVAEMNEKAVEIAKSVYGEPYVAGNVGPTGLITNVGFTEWYDLFFEQIEVLGAAGVDFFCMETFALIHEAKAAVIAAKDYNKLSGKDIPIICQLSFEDMGRTSFGTDPASAAVILDSLGVDIIGANCGTGPKQMLEIIPHILRHTNKYVIVEPNAGLPKLVNGKSVHPLNIDEFTDYAKRFVELGVSIFGGCCGTTPEYMSRVVKEIKELGPYERDFVKKPRIASYCKTVEISQGVIIGERINPTNRKRVKKEIRNNNLLTLIKDGTDQEKEGAQILDVNMGVPGTDEALNMQKIVAELSQVVQIPLMLDSSDYRVLESGLKAYPSKAIINSTSADPEKMKVIFKLAKKYGASVVGLTMDNQGIPDNPNERLKLAKRIVDFGSNYIPQRDILIDCVVSALGADHLAAKKTLESVKIIKEQGFTTVLGVSNVSSRMPARKYINKVFLDLAFEAGLDAAIYNPRHLDADIPNEARELIEKMLLGDTSAFEEFNQKFNDIKLPTSKTDKSVEDKIKDAIIFGDKTNIVSYVNECLQSYDAKKILSEILLSAMDEAGRLSDRGKIFLPGLLQSAEAMNKAVEVLKPYLPSKDSDKGFVLATVKGDIHDLGKNIVKLYLENYGYKVIDLGKDVPAEDVVKAALENNASYIGLSALMTTTMEEMPKVVKLAEQKGLSIRIFIGGAAVDGKYAGQIGAYYAKGPVKLIELLKHL